MAKGEQIRVDIVADDQASKVIDKVADKAKELEDLDPEVEILSNADRVAADLKQLAQAAEVELEQAAAAADALGRALGPELTGRMNMGSVLADLQRLGLTLDEITADADQLAAALKQMDQVNVKALDSGLGGASSKLKDLGGEADNSRSVLANMVGNTTQELGELGGIAGGAGVAIGQLGEYATEGNISLAGLAQVAGPMAYLALATQTASDMMKRFSESSARTDERVDAIAESMKGGADAASAYEDHLREIGEVTLDNVRAQSGLVNVLDEAKSSWAVLGPGAKLFFDALGKGEDEVENITPLLVDANVALDDWSGFVAAGTDGAKALADQLATTGLSADQQKDVLTALAQAQQDVGTATLTAAEATAFYGDTSKDTTGSVDGLVSSTWDAVFATKDAAVETDNLSDKLTRAEMRADAVSRSFQRMRDELDVEQTVHSFETTMVGALTRIQDEGIGPTTDELLDMKGQIIAVGETADLNPVVVKSSIEALEQGDLFNALGIIQNELNKHPVGIPTKLLPPSARAGSGGSVGPIPTMVPVPPDGGGTAPSVVNVYQSIPRGWRGDPLADARKAARRSGGLYQRSRR